MVFLSKVYIKSSVFFMCSVVFRMLFLALATLQLCIISQ